MYGLTRSWGCSIHWRRMWVYSILLKQVPRFSKLRSGLCGGPIFSLFIMGGRKLFVHLHTLLTFTGRPGGTYFAVLLNLAWGRLCHSQSTEALGSLAWPCSHQQYTFTWDYSRIPTQSPGSRPSWLTPTVSSSVAPSFENIFFFPWPCTFYSRMHSPYLWTRE